NGGAFNNQGTLSISNANISNNTAGIGGAVLNSGTLSISNSTLSGNTASTTGSTGGGAINNQSGNLTITNSTLSNNSAWQGGAIAVQPGGSLNLSNSIISSNHATGIYGNAIGGGILNLGTTVISNTTISLNTGIDNYSSGGGIYNLSGNLTISGSAIFGNTAGNGGGIYNLSILDIYSSTVSNNTAIRTDGGGGGGIYNLQNSTVTITNCTLSGNAGVAGGGILNFGALNIANTIIANSTSGGDYLASFPGTIGTNTNNLVEDGSITNTSSNPTGSGDRSGDPLLGPLQNNGGPTFTQALLFGSSAIGNGNSIISNAAPINGLDQRGFVRTTSDIGAYSYNFASAGNAVV
ncbi:MAG: hypothetical protein EBQ87_00935, partial [Planctomycetes bacterium]|nr:hypothetical protein [Planctomycetota bacterium]